MHLSCDQTLQCLHSSLEKKNTSGAKTQDFPHILCEIYDRKSVIRVVYILETKCLNIHRLEASSHRIILFIRDKREEMISAMI